MKKVDNKGDKGNPYHDEEGKFTSADDASNGGNEKLEIKFEAGSEKPTKKDDNLDTEMGVISLAFDVDNIDDFLDSMEGGLTKGEKKEKAREIVSENSKYLEYTNYSELNISIEKKKEWLDVSPQEYDKEKIADLSNDEVEALYQAESVLNSKRQNEQKIAQLEDDKKQIESSKDKLLSKALVDYQNEGKPVWIYGVWANSVSLVDYESKAKVDETGTSAIDRKRQYYEDIINDEFGFDDEIAAAQQKLNELNAWVEAGEQYLNYKKQIDADYIDAIEGIEAQLGEAKKQQEFFNSDEFKAVLEDNKKFIEIYQDKNAPYSKARKDAAIWFTGTNNKSAYTQAKQFFGPQMNKKWMTLTPAERNIVVSYTGNGFSRFNKPLRGIVQDPGGYGFSASEGKFSKAVMDMTNAIDKCVWDNDIWVQRGIDDSKIFQLPGSLSLTNLSNLNNAQLQSLVGTSFTDGGFFSAGAGKGTGFTGREIIFNTYCPKGTKMIYIAEKSNYSSENEMILQRGYSYKITKIEKKGWQYYVDVEVVLGSEENKPTGNKLKEIGNKYFYAPRGQKGEDYD